ncbi:MAG: hypothetical protein QOG35_1120 [Solirubrobacteraceae bacterium]|jgi:steroid delta-isomerase-like uncharacterized protein|nr:hypothetical protein [Solirubrobacteraceae bacterium]
MSATSSTTPTLQKAQSFFDAYDRHDVEAMLGHLSDDAEIRYVPMGDQGRGPAREVGRAIWSGLIDAFPDLRIHVESMFGDDRHVAAEVVIGGTQRKDFAGIRNQGRHYDLPHAFLLTLTDGGRITLIACYWDNASFYGQLGATPPA